METTIRIMDLDIDMISMDSFLSKVEEYLTNDYLNVILFATTKVLEEASENDEYKEMLARAELILPGEEALLSMHHVDVLEVARMVINYQCFDKMLDSIQENSTMYLVGRSEYEMNQMKEYCIRNHPHINIVGTCFLDIEQNGDVVINEINGLAPDILVFSLDSPLQEAWILTNCTKMNAKLCIGMGGVINNIFEQNREMPRFVQMLHLEKLYNLLKKNKRLNKIRQARIFKRKIAHYKNKKSE